MLDKRGHVPLYIQLKNDILDKIKREVWPEGTQIPTEKALMAEYGVGRATVREAISILENGGYLVKRHGIGTFVTRSQPSFGFEPLISLTYSLRSKGIHANNVIAEKRIITPGDDILTKMRSGGMEKCLYLKRFRYANGIPIAIEDSYFSEEYVGIEERHDLTESLARIILRDLHVTIKKVEQVVILRQPSQNEQETLQIGKDVQVLDMERWIYIQDKDAPFYYLNFIIPSNIYSLSGY
jgi:GntR family transcriptional regulator